LSVDGPAAGRFALLSPRRGQGSPLPVGLVVALPEEARTVARVIGDQRRWSHGGCRLLEGTCAGSPIVMAWAGAGSDRAARAADTLLDHGVSALLAVGFAGALVPHLEPADLVAATEVAVQPGERIAAAAELLAPLAGASIRTLLPSLYQGPLLSLPRVATSGAEKRRLGEETGALAVDMESGAVVRRAAEAGVASVALRVITDRADEDLPLDFNLCLDPNGQFCRARLILQLARRPGAVSGLVRLGRHSVQAGRALASFLAWYLPRCAPARSGAPDSS
jgi:adenosylhomocysteine nucleosidase